MIKFWGLCSEYQKSMLLLIVLIFMVYVGQAIQDSSKVSLNSNGFEITKTAIANQVQLQQALQIIKFQQQEISEIKDKAIAINERTGVGGKLVKDLDNLEAKFPPDYAKELEQTIEQSESVLNPDRNYDQGN